MKIYDKNWARRIVTQWEENNPRVSLMVNHLAGLAAKEGVQSPREFVIERLVLALQKAGSRSDWRTIKASLDYPISWDSMWAEIWPKKKIPQTWLPFGSP